MASPPPLTPPRVVDVLEQQARDSLKRALDLAAAPGSGYLTPEKKPRRAPCESAVLNARYARGASTGYLQTGLAVLAPSCGSHDASTAMGLGAPAEALASMRDGVERGLRRAQLQRRNDAPDQLRHVLESVQLLLEVASVREAVDAALSSAAATGPAAEVVNAALAADAPMDAAQREKVRAVLEAVAAVVADDGRGVLKVLAEHIRVLDIDRAQLRTDAQALQVQLAEALAQVAALRQAAGTDADLNVLREELERANVRVNQLLQLSSTTETLGLLNGLANAQAQLDAFRAAIEELAASGDMGADGELVGRLRSELPALRELLQRLADSLLRALQQAPLPAETPAPPPTPSLIPSSPAQPPPALVPTPPSAPAAEGVPVGPVYDTGVTREVVDDVLLPVREARAEDVDRRGGIASVDVTRPDMALSTNAQRQFYRSVARRFREMIAIVIVLGKDLDPWKPRDVEAARKQADQMPPEMRAWAQSWPEMERMIQVSLILNYAFDRRNMEEYHLRGTGRRVEIRDASTLQDQQDLVTCAVTSAPPPAMAEDDVDAAAAKVLEATRLDSSMQEAAVTVLRGLRATCQGAPRTAFDDEVLLRYVDEDGNAFIPLLEGNAFSDALRKQLTTAPQSEPALQAQVVLNRVVLLADDIVWREVLTPQGRRLTAQLPEQLTLAHRATVDLQRHLARGPQQKWTAAVDPWSTVPRAVPGTALIGPDDSILATLAAGFPGAAPSLSAAREPTPTVPPTSFGELVFKELGDVMALTRRPFYSTDEDGSPLLVRANMVLRVSGTFQDGSWNSSLGWYSDTVLGVARTPERAREELSIMLPPTLAAQWRWDLSNPQLPSDWFTGGNPLLQGGPNSQIVQFLWQSIRSSRGLPPAQMWRGSNPGANWLDHVQSTFETVPNIERPSLALTRTRSMSMQRVDFRNNPAANAVRQRQSLGFFTDTFEVFGLYSGWLSRRAEEQPNPLVRGATGTLDAFESYAQWRRRRRETNLPEEEDIDRRLRERQNVDQLTRNTSLVLRNRGVVQVRTLPLFGLGGGLSNPNVVLPQLAAHIGDLSTRLRLDGADDDAVAHAKLAMAHGLPTPTPTVVLGASTASAMAARLPAMKLVAAEAPPSSTAASTQDASSLRARLDALALSTAVEKFVHTPPSSTSDRPRVVPTAAGREGSHAVLNALETHLRAEPRAVPTARALGQLAFARLALPTSADASAEPSAEPSADATRDAARAFFDTQLWQGQLDAGRQALDVLSVPPEAAEALLRPAGGNVPPRDPRPRALVARFIDHMALSEDLLYIFLKRVAGHMGVELSEILHLDPDDAKQQEAYAEAVAEANKRVAESQAKIVEILVSGMLKDSKLALSAEDKDLVVIDEHARRELAELANGESGKPFFAASVSLRNLTSAAAVAPPLHLAELMRSVADATEPARAALLTSMATGTGGLTTRQLAQPEHSRLVRLRDDVATAIVTAHQKLEGTVGLWELCEGGCAGLSDRFAELVALIQRGTAALALTPEPIKAGREHRAALVQQARVALQRVETGVRGLRAVLPRPPSLAKLRCSSEVTEEREDRVRKAAGVDVRARPAACRYERGGYYW